MYVNVNPWAQICVDPCKKPCFTGVSEIQQDKFFSGIPPLASGALENQKSGGLC